MSTSCSFMSGSCASRWSSSRDSRSVVCCRSRSASRAAAAACSASPALMSRSTSSLRTSPSSVRDSLARRSASRCRARMRSATRRLCASGVGAGSCAAQATDASTRHASEIVKRRDIRESMECENYTVSRIAALDVGERRIGVAVSDLTGTLARPVGVLKTSGLDGDALERAASEVARLAAEDDGLATLVVGLPRHLDGSPSEMTPRVEAFAARLRARTELPVVLQDERLTSREAESRLAIREKDWRVRKDRLDAAAAAVILQEYLDGR